MTLNEKQIASLLKQVAATEADSLGCDDCLTMLAEFAERELADLPVPEALNTVQLHLKQCTCCQEEYGALLDALRAVQS